MERQYAHVDVDMRWGDGCWWGVDVDATEKGGFGGRVTCGVCGGMGVVGGVESKV